MNIPVDTSGVVLLCGSGPEPVTVFATGAAKTDPVTGAVLVQVVFMWDGRPEVAAVKVPGPLSGLSVGVPVQIGGLVATTWQMGERSGVAFRAQTITAAAGAGREQQRSGS